MANDVEIIIKGDDSDAQRALDRTKRSLRDVGKTVRNVGLGMAAFGAAAVLAGCGYTTGYRMPDGVQRMFVPIFANETFPLRREIEYDLTRAVKQELELRSDVQLVSENDADARLDGTVVSFREAPLTEGPLDVEQETSIDVTVQVRLVRISDDRVLFEGPIHDHATFSIIRGQSVADARAEAIQEIAERLVSELEAW